ncbi:sensor histidine kinase [Ectothiorhodospiraceae bacterium BW-2]|nr:sensor histidine kinase [Ectothiorhodospiraceae bacterium BW-2]
MLARVKTHVALGLSRRELHNTIDTLVENVQLNEELEQIKNTNLKRPLASVLQLAESLQSNPAVGFEPKESIGLIHNAAYEMLGLINQSQDLLLIERGEYQFQPEQISLTEITFKAVFQVRRTLQREQGGEQAKVEFQAPDERIMGWGESLLCYSMIENLLWNGLVLSGSSNQVKVEIAKSEESKIVLNVSFPAQLSDREQQALFERSAGAMSLGIGRRGGAYIACKMAQLHQGELTFSQEGGSGRFELALPQDRSTDMRMSLDRSVGN